MKSLKHLFLALVTVGFSHAAIAEKWNDATLKTAKGNAIQSINQFINKDKHSELYRMMSDNERKALRLLINENRQAKSFADLKNKTTVIVAILDASYRNRVPYAALLLQYSSKASNNYNGNAVYLYRNILQSDEDSAAYAFKQLDRLTLAADSKLAKERQKLHKNYGFHLSDIRVEQDREKPEVCLSFTRRVRPEPSQQWQTLINVTPKPDGDWGYRGRELCFFGQWQTRYQVHVNAKLQSDNRLTLETARDETVATGMRAPMVRFAAEGSVLNAAEARQLAIATANVDSVKLSLWQIPANNLSNGRVQNLIENSPQTLSGWDLSRSESTLLRESEHLYRGTFDVEQTTANETVTTNVFFEDLLDGKPAKPGIYVMTASNANAADDNDSTAQMVFALSNAGFSAYLTDEGLWAELRDLSSTQAVVGQTVTLYAKNNRILGTATTDSKGIAHFAKPLIIGKDGLRPDHLISEDDRYFAYLDVIDTPIDLSDKGLSGSVESAPLQSWIWSDRGIYRPNDSAHIMWLLKTDAGKPYHDTPVWLELLRPDGKVVLDEMVKADDSGSYSFDYDFSNNARQGDWSLRLFLGKGGALISEKTLPVSAITPQQIEVAVKPFAKPLPANKAIAVTVQADWLYGAPATGLTAYLNYRLHTADLPQADLKGWQIGLHDESVFDDSQFTDKQSIAANGTTTFSVTPEKLPFSTRPLSFETTAFVTEPSGQQVRGKQQGLIEREQPYLGLLAAEQIPGDAVKKNQVLVNLFDQHGKAQAGKADWQLYRVNYDYYWYNTGSRWEYQHNESRQLVKQGLLTMDGKQPTTLDLPTHLLQDDGAWVVVVRGSQANIAASLFLEYGRYAAPSKGSAPDRVSISSDKTRYADGETVTLHLRAPFDGEASIKLASRDRIIDNRLTTFADGKATLQLTWDKAWDQGLWILANAWNKDQVNAHNRRAVGLHWLGGDLAPYSIDMAIDLPETTVPESTLTIPLHLPQSQRLDGQTTWARVAVVDDGLYRLAKASFSNPLQTFFGKKQLTIDFFDVWGSIIRQVKARQAALRSGAGDDESDELSALKALPELDLQLVAFWSKPVAFDAEGNAAVSVDLPQFNGRLRVMAAAWNDTQLGAAEHTVQVRAPLVATLYSPPYLSPKDRSSLRLRLHNTTDREMTVTTAVSAQGVTMPQVASKTLTLKPDEVTWVERDFSVDSNPDSKRARFEITVGGDENVRIDRFADIRPAAYPQKSLTLAELAGGQTQTFSALDKGRVFERSLFISANAPYDPNSVLQQLSTYPYGCAEQTTSKAWNNILLQDLIPRYRLDAKAWGNDSTRESRLLTAQVRLANMQGSDGGFSLWGYGNSTLWLSAYVTDFLLDSQRQNQLSSSATLNRALQYLRREVMIDGDNATARAYAHYVLAKAGQATQGAAQRFAEGLLSDNTVKLNVNSIYTTAALVNHGELQLANKLLQTAQQQGIDEKGYTHYGYYGSALRNYAQSLSVLYELQAQLKTLKVTGDLPDNVGKAINALWQPARQTLSKKQYYSTQDLHWLAALAARLPHSDGTARLTVNGKALTVEGSQRLTLDNHAEVKVVNQDKDNVYLTFNDWVVPPMDKVQENGYSITMRYEDKDGNPVDISQLSLNQQVLAIATITRENNNGDSIFVYPLPSGLSIVPLSQNFEPVADRAWAKTVQHPTFSEDRDDRHIAAFDDQAGNSFTHVFRLRAARLGTWHTPAYSIENMYLPQYRAVYPTATVTVTK